MGLRHRALLKLFPGYRELCRQRDFLSEHTQKVERRLAELESELNELGLAHDGLLKTQAKTVAERNETAAERDELQATLDRSLARIAELEGMVATLKATGDALQANVEALEAEERRMRTLLAPEGGGGAHRIHIVGYARSGTTVIMDILNSSKEVLILSEFNAYIFNRFPALGSQFGGSVYSRFVDKKQRDIPLLYKGGLIQDLGEPYDAEELFSHLNRTYRYVGDKIAVSFKQYDGANELELLPPFIEENASSNFIFTIRRPDENIASNIKKFKPADPNVCAYWMAATWALTLCEFLKLNRSYLVFHEDITGEIIEELEALFGLHCELGKEYVGAPFKQTRADGGVSLAEIRGLDELMACYQELRAVFSGDKGALKRSRTDALVKRMAKVVERIEAYVLANAPEPMALLPHLKPSEAARVKP